MYTGWITVSRDKQDNINNEIDFLSNMGVNILHISESMGNQEDFTFKELQIELNDEVMNRLNPFWGRFIWGLRLDSAK